MVWVGDGGVVELGEDERVGGGAWHAGAAVAEPEDVEGGGVAVGGGGLVGKRVSGGKGEGKESGGEGGG